MTAHTLPDEPVVDGDPLTLRRVEENALTGGPERIYSDDTTLRQIDSRNWELQSTYYGNDRKRIKHPFDA